MCNKNVIKSRALDKLDELLKEALSNYKETKDIQFLCVTIPTGYFSDEEYKEVESNKENINSSPDMFVKYCEYRGIEIPKDLQDKKTVRLEL
jgi:hypothetical protein